MSILIVLLLIACCLPAQADEYDSSDTRWLGHDFVFCFVTDDGRTSNLAWAETARSMDFRFSIAVNTYRCKIEVANVLTLEQVHDLAEDDFEIMNHGYSHGELGLPLTCPMPPRGSLMGYYLCEDCDPVEAMEALHVEIERDSIAELCDLDVTSIKTLAYPRHRFGRALIDSLVAEGYIGARAGGRTSYVSDSYGDYQTEARNGWEEGISLFHVPLTIATASLFGDHCTDPATHWPYDQFYDVAMPLINSARLKGGMFIIYAHHLGNDDDTFGDVNYSSGGFSQQDLEWIVDLVRANNGIVMPFGEAAAYYRARSSMVVLDDDYVWKHISTAVETPEDREVPVPGTKPTLSAWPNPFNPSTKIEGEIGTTGELSLDVFDVRGAHVKTLASGYYQAGLHDWTWDGQDQSGDRQPAGIYVLRLKTKTGSAVMRLMLIK